LTDCKFLNDVEKERGAWGKLELYVAGAYQEGGVWLTRNGQQRNTAEENLQVQIWSPGIWSSEPLKMARRDVALLIGLRSKSRVGDRRWSPATRLRDVFASGDFT
jgi:hypothetical protein